MKLDRISSRKTPIVNVILSIPVKHCDIHPPVLISGLEIQLGRPVKEIGIKDDRAVFPIRNRCCTRLLVSQERLDPIRTTIV
jgi:hypothetical protein